MNKMFVPVLFIFLIVISGAAFAEDSVASDVSQQVEKDYLDLIDQHVAELTHEYSVSGETESLLVRRAVKNYILADLADYTLLIYMAKYNVATGGIDMKRANAEIIRSLQDLSDNANSQMLENLNALRMIKGLKPIRDKQEAIK